MTITDTTIYNTETAPSGGHSGIVRKWAPLIVMSLALAIIILDTTILNVSLRTIIGDLDTTIQKIQWVITAYSLVLAAFTITGGRLGDLFGRKKMFVVGAIVFAAGSFMASISRSVGMMIAGEAIIEGIGAALMMPATASLLVSNYKGHDRQVAFGVWGGIAAASAALGPIFGGWLTTYYSWRWAFRINIFVVALVVLGSFIIKEYRDTEEKPELDLGGIALSSLGLLLVVFGFIESSTYGWWKAKQIFMIGGHSLEVLGGLSIVIPSLLWGLVLLAVFILWEMRRESAGHTPLVSLGLFRNTRFVTASSIIAILSLGMAGMSFSIPIFLQAVKKLDALHTGLAMLPMPLTILFVAPFSVFLAKRVSAKHLIQSALFIAVCGFLVLRASIDVAASVWALAPGFILFGIGMGLIMSQGNNMALSAVSVEQAGEASGVNGTLRQIGMTLGSAVIGAVLLSTLGANLVSGVETSAVIPDDMKPALSKLVSEQTSNIEFGSGAETGSQTISPDVKKEIASISAEATVDANKEALIYGAAFLFLAFLLASKLPAGKIGDKPAAPATAH